jgi:hypothetical protein
MKKRGGGMAPVKVSLLCCKLRRFRSVEFQIEAGIVSKILLVATSDRCLFLSSEENEQAGRLERLLYDTSTNTRWLRLQRTSGREPERLQLRKSTLSSIWLREKSGNVFEEDKSEDLTLSFCRCSRFDTWRLPVKLLKDKSNFASLGLFANVSEFKMP